MSMFEREHTSSWIHFHWSPWIILLHGPIAISCHFFKSLPCLDSSFFFCSCCYYHFPSVFIAASNQRWLVAFYFGRQDGGFPLFCIWLCVILLKQSSSNKIFCVINVATLCPQSANIIRLYHFCLKWLCFSSSTNSPNLLVLFPC